MIKFWMHRRLGHRAWSPGRGYAHFYYCSTCARGWDGLVFKAGKPWTSR